uniref:Profilin n=1 Tax=Paramormyrops kingsleyae TaxID=1676925 RepID=A0A3B3TC87_9TELE
MNRLQILIDDCLIGTKHVGSAAILTIKNASVAAATARFNVSMCSKHCALCTLYYIFLFTRERGLSFQDKSYTCVRADRNSVYSKSNAQGLILVKTSLYIIVATYNENMYPSVCVEAVEKLADYLREKEK